MPILVFVLLLYAQILLQEAFINQPFLSSLQFKIKANYKQSPLRNISVKKYIITTALSMCCILSPMDNVDNTTLMNTPTPRVIRTTLKSHGFGVMDIQTNISTILGNKKDMKKTSISNYLRRAFLEYNNSYQAEQLTVDTNKATEAIISVSTIQIPPIKPSKLVQISSKL